MSQLDWKREWNGIMFIFRPHAGIKTTWADALFGIQSVLVMMLNRDHPSAFRESAWDIARRRRGTSSRTMRWVARIFIGIATQNPPLDDPAFVPSTASNASGVTAGPLSAPFVVPETQMALLFGSGGVKLSQLAIIAGLDEMIGRAWRNVAINGRAQPMMGDVFEITSPQSTCWLQLRPRMERATSMFTETDLVEASVGIVYYMIQNGFYATKITAVRPNVRGIRIAVGEIDFSVVRPSVRSSAIGNSSLIQVV